MPPKVDVAGLMFDEENEAKFTQHRVTPGEVQQVLDRSPRFFSNTPARRAPVVMMGPTIHGRLLVIPLEAAGDGIWRPVTAFEPTPAQVARYRSQS